MLVSIWEHHLEARPEVFRHVFPRDWHPRHFQCGRPRTCHENVGFDTGFVYHRLNAAAPQVAEATHSEPVVTAMSGPQVYNAACIACHGSGIGGAPTVGDAAAWQARIAQGNDTLYLHAIEGYTGSTGFMPQKGGRMDLSDDEVHGAVDYMVGESQN